MVYMLVSSYSLIQINMINYFRTFFINSIENRKWFDIHLR